MAIGVPGKGADTVAFGNAGVVQSVGELHAALAPLAVGVAMRAGVGLGDDLFAWEEAGYTVEKVLQCEWVVHHQALHGCSPLMGEIVKITFKTASGCSRLER